ncbi:MAG: hypothetical protein PHU04_04360 [Candidatus Peribacteraceae bacterium]|nr:hypothetical protein [Candidatus Peribacteraceae bacterium]
MEVFLHAIIALLRIPSASAAGALQQYDEYWSIFGPGAGGGNLLVALAVRVAAMATLFIGGMATIGVLLGAIKIVTSGGNDEGKNKGKSMIIASLVGVALAVLGAGLVEFVQTFLESVL